MSTTRNCLLALAAISVLAAACKPQSSVPVKGEPPANAPQGTEAPSPPWDTKYQLDSVSFTLTQGQARFAAAPGSSAMIEVSLIGDAVHADLNDDDHDDVAFLVRVERGGSGTFYYVAAALEGAGRYRGTNLVLVGDRIAPEGLTERRGVIQVRYLDRGDDEPMSSPPTRKRQAYTMLTGERLQRVVKLGADEDLFDAVVTIGHEARAIRPCSVSAEAWLSGRSPALQEVLTSYRKGRYGSAPYTPLLMVLTGRLSKERDSSEFGSEYEFTFTATRLVRTLSQQTC